MRIVSENTPEQLEAKRKDQQREDALDKVRWSLRELAANIMRVTRGAGKSYELGPQAQEFIASLIEYRDAAGVYPASWELDQALTIQRDEEWMERLSPEALDEVYAERQILRGALQVVASKLVGQLTIQRSGEGEMHGGMRRLDEIREERRKKYRAEMRASKPKKVQKRRKRIAL